MEVDARFPKGTTLDLVVGVTGAKDVRVPWLMGLSLDDAKRHLDAAQPALGHVGYMDDVVTALDTSLAVVVSQDVNTERKPYVSEGTAIDLSHSANIEFHQSHAYDFQLSLVGEPDEECDPECVWRPIDLGHDRVDVLRQPVCTGAGAIWSGCSFLRRVSKRLKRLVQGVAPCCLPWACRLWTISRGRVCTTSRRRSTSNAGRRAPSAGRPPLAYQAPTIGCATLDGLDAVGNPYALNPTNAVGYADFDVSPIVAGRQCAGDSVAFVFLVPIGRHRQRCRCWGRQFDCGIRNTAEDDPWQWVWSTEGIDNDTAFHPVVVPIVGTEYFHNEFQFRILNYGALEGNVDTWHLDFVRVDEDGMEPAPLFEEWRLWHRRQALASPMDGMPWPHLSTLWTATLRPR